MSLMKKARSSSSSLAPPVIPSKVAVTFLSQPTPIPSSYLTECWDAHLRDPLRRILRGDLSSVIGKREVLYREVERLVNLKFTHAVAEKFEFELQNYSSSLFQSSVSVDTIVEAFDRFEESLDLVLKIFNALDREFRFLATNSRDPKTARDLRAIAYTAWRHALTEAADGADLSALLVDWALSGIQEVRMGKGEKILLISKIINLILKLDIYSVSFEAKHIFRTKTFYAETPYPTSLSAFLQYVQAVFMRETELHACMHTPGSTWKIIDAEILRNELILLRLPALIQTDLASLVRTFDVSSLKLLFQLSNLVNEKIISESVLRFSFAEAVASVCSESLHAGPLDAASVDRLLQFRSNIFDILCNAFENKISFVNSFKDAVETVINGTDFAPFPALLAVWMDARITSAEEDTPLWLNAVMSIFKLLAAKDIFEAHYRSHLARRLIHLSSNLSSFQDALNLESAVITLLKTECGAGYTNKLETMLKDIGISATAEKKIEGDLELNVFVITTGVWPSTISVWAEKPQLPPEVELAQTEFVKVYSVANPKRSIKFVHSMSSAIVKYKHKELVCSAAQALILNLFNEFESLSTESFLTDCRIPESELSRALNALVEAGVVIGQGKIYHVNPQFKFPTGMIRLALNQYQYRRPASSTPYSEEERAQTESSVNEDRLHQLDAAIVRIMKRVKKCSHAFLSGEIMESSKYLFSKVEISKRVASLIDREFLERQSGEDGEIRYLA